MAVFCHAGLNGLNPRFHHKDEENGNFEYSSRLHTYVPGHEKTNVLHMQKQKAQISFAVTAKLITAFVFATWIVLFLYFLNPNFQPLCIFCACTAQFVSDLFKNHNVGFLLTQLICT